jgi:hypothetical protein
VGDRITGARIPGALGHRLRTRWLLALVGLLVLGGAGVGLYELESNYEPDQSYAEAVTRSSPLAWWRFDELQGPAARDARGHFQAQYGGGIGLGVIGPLSNRVDTAASFDGKGSYLSAGDVLDFPGRSPFTIEVWVKPRRQPTPFSRIVSKEVHGIGRPRQGYVLYADNQLGYGLERFRGGRGQSVVSTRPLRTGKYTFVTATFDGQVMRMFLNGRLVASDRYRRPIRLRNVVTPFVVGRLEPPNSTGFFSGSLDELAVYPRALGSNEIAAHKRAAD